MDTKPIVIIGTSRSGTSLTAGIFAEHGVWTGVCMPPDHRNPKGFFENKQMKAFFKSGPSTPEAWKRKHDEILASEGYNGGPYLFKHGWERWPLWSWTKPYIIACRRPYDDFSKSRIKAGFPPLAKSAWLHAQKVMDDIIKQNGGVNVYADDFKRGDFSSIENALKYCGVEVSTPLIYSFYDPQLWSSNDAQVKST